MTDEEMKNKYGDFITKISEILGLGRPVDILKLCATTDLFFQPLDKRIAELEKENAELKANNQFLNNLVREKEQRGLEIQEDLLRENEKLKAEVGSSIDCEKAQKNGELCLGYSGDEDEPCERCKNCIKCEGGYYQLGETEKDEQLTKAKDLLVRLSTCLEGHSNNNFEYELIKQAEQFLNSEVEK